MTTQAGPMFTGLIEHTAVIKAHTTLSAGVRLTLESPFTDLVLGESVAIDGACLTVCAIEGNTFRVELSPTTLNITCAAHYRVGQVVNIERSMQAGARFGGHFVTGHIDKTVKLLEKRSEGEFQHWRIGPFTTAEQALLVSKGSLCLNGVSLTIQHVHQDACELMLIPHTLSHTTFTTLNVDSPLNLEFDMLAKLVAKQTAGVSHEHSF